MKMLASKNGIILPCDIVNKILMEYCEHDILSITRCLQYPNVQRCTQFSDLKLAIKAGNLENVQWISLRNHAWKKKGDIYLRYAAQLGYLECLKWLLVAALGRSCRTKPQLYAHAAYGGNLDMFTWLLVNGCPLDCRTFSMVIHAGNVEVLEWCIQNGFTFDNDSFYFGASTEKIEVLELLKLHNCPWGTLTILNVRNMLMNSDVVNWLQANGCPDRPAH